MYNEIIYQLALGCVPNIGDHHTRILLQHFSSASKVFRSSAAKLEQIEGIGNVRAQSIKSFSDFNIAERELAFIEKYQIRKLFLNDQSYPKRMIDCNDAPALLFYKGEADLNSSKVIGIVGTRSATEYGKHFTERFVEQLAVHQPLIISGLALGIDAIAHKSAIKNGLPTVGVVGHGLDTIYPSVNTSLAKEMIRNGGGLLSEFFSGTKPDRHNFPLRNRIVAALCDAIVVIETNIKGGSMITAKVADSYNRDVFAVPGRTTDIKSSGCNYLIKNNKAIMLTEAEELVDILGWKKQEVKAKKQKQLFPELSTDQKIVIDLLKEKEPLSIDEINLCSGLSNSMAASAILQLELGGIIESLPGKLYRLT